MIYDSSRPRRKHISKLSGNTYSQKQIYATGAEFSHIEYKDNVEYEVYRLPDGNLVTIRKRLSGEALQKSNSMAFFPTKQQREQRRKEIEAKKLEEEKKLEEIIKIYFEEDNTNSDNFSKK